ncbi:MAG: Na/Pi cotransporter family protein [Acutalibacteraceae bacterium]|nr:Na/Pi cotransporter family protein [Acutalibacteraceae bacterium]
MDIFDFLTMLGGLCLFLFGMNIMGNALERRAGGGLKAVLSKLTTGKTAGLLTGLGVTAVIQSSSATTVMVVGFVNSGIMTLRQSINVIMGANIGTTVTAWILSLAGIDSGNVFVKLLKPSSFTPVLAFIGIIFYMFCKNDKKKDTGLILLGFATLMFGMETMSGAVSGLKSIPQFTQMFIMFKNPVLGVIVGAMLTAIIQSSSASVGILQALSLTGAVSYGAAIPIIMGQNIGTCVTALISSVGANKNAKRAAMVHLSFNVLGTVFWLAVYCVIKAVFSPAILNSSASLFGIAVAHSVFNLLCTVLMLPLGNLLEKFVKIIVPDSKQKEKKSEVDERLLLTPALAIAQSRSVAIKMAECATEQLENSLKSILSYSPKIAKEIRAGEEKCDYYEDIIGTYLIKVSAKKLGRDESEEVTALLKIIGDYERISDHAVNILESAEELRNNNFTLSEDSLKEYEILMGAVSEVLNLSKNAFKEKSTDLAYKVEPLEQVIDELKEQLRTSQILRMKTLESSTEIGFIWSDLLTNLERVSDHCSNIAGCIIDNAKHTLNVHETLKQVKTDSKQYFRDYNEFSQKYCL